MDMLLKRLAQRDLFTIPTKKNVTYPRIMIVQLLHYVIVNVDILWMGNAMPSINVSSKLKGQRLSRR